MRGLMIHAVVAIAVLVTGCTPSGNQLAGQGEPWSRAVVSGQANAGLDAYLYNSKCQLDRRIAGICYGNCGAAARATPMREAHFASLPDSQKATSTNHQYGKASPGSSD